MLSGNGRHRRPRQAPAFVVAAGVTGSAIAIPLLGATGASAADGGTWNKVAECETGGSWSQNTGNGFYGGLHLTLEDWEKYGGTEFAERPDLASRSQQIAVAEKVLADQGVGAWPACGPLSGLAQRSGAADVDTGVENGTSGGTGGTSGTGGSSGSSAEPGGSATTDPDGSAGASGTADGSGASATPGASTPSADTSTGSPEATPDTSGGTGAADGSTATPGATATPETPAQETDSSPTAEPNYDESDNLGQPVGISGLVDTGALGLDGQSGGRHRGPSADEDASGASTAPTGRHAAPAEGAGSGSYTVRVGDSLASIADSLDLDGGWHRLYDDNKDAIGADPSHIVPGQTLRVGG
ncbi:transglycosylase family protein [Streptomyces thermocoprophilus]|uniref:Transglycosylase family protein n=1 Tax=Streptomyces thermocoprophilus TaxID=78356 RepID=A0ABV5VLK4_9ACTN